MKSKAEQICISKDFTLLKALKKMDELMVKSLLITDGDKFISLLSIGDIQRAIINNHGLEEKAIKFVRKDIKIASTTESKEEVKDKIFRYKAECMPIIDDRGNLANVLFWDDFFEPNKMNKVISEKVPVVIMAGGFGSRLKPLTNVIPKPLIPIGDKTIMENIMDRFTRIGLHDFILTVNYKHEMIRFYIENLPDSEYNVSYALEAEPLGTAGSLSLIKDQISSDFFVSNCDILIDDDYANIYDFHKEQKNLLTIVASIKHLRIPYGTLETGENGELISLKEKPEMTFMINTGLYILSPKVFEYIPENTFIHITDVIEKAKANGEKIGVFPISENSWTDIGEWPEYQKILDKKK